jgi:UDP-3-O-[3-hydroxymyristoyl] N-acetylglucosamine deacetylase/3-hydroxyacyl-[acyl-carrier-protein] dehydratase
MLKAAQGSEIRSPASGAAATTDGGLPATAVEVLTREGRGSPISGGDRIRSPLSAGGVRADAEDAAGDQMTLGSEAKITGKGLMLGEEAEVVIRPAGVDHGIVFVRADLEPAVRIAAVVGNVAQRPRSRRTSLKAASGSVTIETVEHCRSALAGLGVNNALIEVRGPELPCGDGSAMPFVEAVLKAGVARQDARRRVYAIREPICVEDEDGAMLAAFPITAESGNLKAQAPKGQSAKTPAEKVGSEDASVEGGAGSRLRHHLHPQSVSALPFSVMFELDYGPQSTRIPRQTQSFHGDPDRYVREIAPARTYSLKEEAQALWDRGMCRHLTPREALVIGEEGPIENAYRFDNEPVRHKVLDLIGDLSLVGSAVAGRFVAYKSGHELNRRMALRIVEQMQAGERRAASLRGRELDIRDIQRIMPHRYPMLLVDRVVKIEGDPPVKAIGVKNVTVNEPFFSGHYPGTPIMPGVLIVEAMAQMGGLLLRQKLEHTGRIAVLLSLDKVKLRHPVTPGDQLMLEAEAMRAKARTGCVNCKAFVGTKLAAEAQIRFMMVDPEQEAVAAATG